MNTPSQPGAAPNIVLIHCHDLGDWLSVYGYRGVPDPNLSALAASGIVFENAFATAPLCTPARSSIFTGLQPHVNGLMGLSHDGWRYLPGIRTLPEILREAGYTSALLGLQHEDVDARVLGYDEVHGLGFLPRALEVARLTERWLTERTPSDQPYCAVIGMWEVHRPWPLEDYEPVDPASVTVPPYLPDNPHARADISAFSGAIKQMDEAVGRIIKAVDESPNGDETFIIFTTDHGAAFPRAKSTLYDSGVKVAFIVRPPRSWDVVPGKRTGLASHLDVVPTLVELAGIDATDRRLEGMSLLPALRYGDADNDERHLVFEKTYHDRYDAIRAIRTKDFKYIRNLTDGPMLPLSADLELSATRAGMDNDHLKPRPAEELYALAADPWELSNRIDDPEMEAPRQRLAAELQRSMERTGDPVLTSVVPPPDPPRRL